jgi:hypothetical protein
MLRALYDKIRFDAAPTIIEVEGRKYTSKEVYPCFEKGPEPLEVKTLTGLVDYVKAADMDGMETNELFAYVVSPSEVRLITSLRGGGFNHRHCYVVAKLDQLYFPFNTYISGEQFNVSLQACFTDLSTQYTDREQVIRYASNVVAMNEAQINDDGITQAVTVRRGIVGKDVDALPNPVLLAPYRTFTEVPQPPSQFVFRCKQDDGGMKFMLAEADGGAWKGEAMQEIKKYLNAELPDLVVIA